MLKQTLNNIVSNRKKIILYVVTVVISVVLLILGYLIVYDDEVMFLGGYDDNACPATVTEIVYKDTENVVIDGEIAGEESIVIFKCKITAGELKGETVVATESTSAYDAVPLDLVQVGDKILIARLEDAEEIEGAEWFMHDYDRTLPLWILGALFILLVLLFGKMKGVNLDKTIEKIVRERKDYKKRVKDAKKEYKFYEKNKDKIDFMVYTDYSTKTDEKVDEIINRILRD